MSRTRSIRPLPLLTGLFFTGAGVMHFVRPDFFEAIVPDWFPDAPLANRMSGIAEIALGLGLLPRRTRRASAMGLLALLIIVFPANVDMAINDVEVKPVDGTMTRSVGTATGVSRMVNWARLPLQLPLAFLVWKVTHTPGSSDHASSPDRVTAT